MTIAGIVNFMGAFGKEIKVGGNISNFFIAQGIAMVIVRSFSGKIFDKFGHRILIIPAAISGAAGLMLLGFATNMMMVLVAGVLFGIAFAVIHTTTQAWALTLVPPEKKATANSMLLIFIDSGMAIGSAALGLLANNVGYGMTYRYSSAIMIIILLLYLFGSRKPMNVLPKKQIIVRMKMKRGGFCKKTTGFQPLYFFMERKKENYFKKDWYLFINYLFLKSDKKSLESNFKQRDKKHPREYQTQKMRKLPLTNSENGSKLSLLKYQYLSENSVFQEDRELYFYHPEPYSNPVHTMNVSALRKEVLITYIFGNRFIRT